MPGGVRQRKRLPAGPGQGSAMPTPLEEPLTAKAS